MRLIARLLREMDPNSSPVPSRCDPAPVNIMTASAGPPALELVAPAGPMADTPSLKKVLETLVANNSDQPTGGAAAPTLKSSKRRWQPKKTVRHRTGFTSSDSSDESEDWDNTNEYRLLRSVDEDPDEETAGNDAKDPNWRWPSYDKVYDRSGNYKYAKRGKAPKKAVTKGFPFQIIYHNSQHIVLWPDAVQIKLKSPHLLAILSEYLLEEKELTYLENVNVDGRRVYVVLEKLKRHQLSSNANERPSISSAGLVSGDEGSFMESSEVSSGGPHGNSNLAIESPGTQDEDLMSSLERSHELAGEPAEEAGRHLNHLVRFLEEEYRVVVQKQQHLKEHKSVSFDMLWAFLTPGTTVVYHCNYTQEQLCGKVQDNDYHQTRCGKVFNVTLDVWDYNGVDYRQCTATRILGEFGGEQPFDTLAVFPIDMDRTTSAETLKAEFLAKGRRFQKLAMRSSNCFMGYKGAIFRLRQEKADGRVMIDLKSFAVMNPNHPMGTAQPPVSSDENERNGHPGIAANRDRMLNNRRANLRGTTDLSDEAAQALVGRSSQEVEDETLVFAPGIVYGFSFTLKLWGPFSVSGFSEIDFDTAAIDALVMEPELKGLLYSLVSTFIATPTVTSGQSSSAEEDLPRVDPIANKGEGCIFLCYGPPGTGKTLTAESLAENLRQPLWSLSVAELGTTPSDLEKTLLKVLEFAAMWKAVLLLDEADVYLEKRVAATDMKRNAMTGVFLRLLEYYRGVLFLTTNRITTFDDAFRSRISLMVCYPKLTQERREQICRTSLERVQAGKGEEVKVGQGFLADMARYNINGREIRNVINTAQTLAKSKNKDLQERHLRLVMSVVAQSSDTLDAALREV